MFTAALAIGCLFMAALLFLNLQDISWIYNGLTLSAVVGFLFVLLWGHDSNNH